jgi:hypothetical protein
LGADVESGRDRINHVLIASPRVRRDESDPHEPCTLPP